MKDDLIKHEKAPQKEEFTDSSRMPFGQYKGALLSMVPVKYLLYLHSKGRAGRLTDYIDKKIEEAQKDKPKKK